MRVVFMGSSEFSIPSLEKLLGSQHDVVAVYSKAPKPAGRGYSLTKTPLHSYADSHGIPVRNPITLNAPGSAEAMAEYSPDVIVVVSYGLILPKWVLCATKFGCINVHPSLLPRWRGAAPMEHTILSGDSITGVTIMCIDEGIDSGDIFLQEETPVGEKENIVELRHRLSHMGSDLLLKVMDNLDSIVPVKQGNENITYANKITDFRIDFNNSADYICRQIRAVYPKAFFMLSGTRVRILDAEGYTFSGDMDAGCVINDKLHIKCGDNTALVPLVVQRESRNPCDIESFLRGLTLKGIPSEVS
ncbi:methionyl-tRNA formyltransferase [Anaplasma bovis]|uniref:methionyl-tRNA formyltransferase n=1 Tax=Anaplasma bovis TaxID=186733 RepID=UPI002FF35948